MKRDKPGLVGAQDLPQLRHLVLAPEEPGEGERQAQRRRKRARGGQRRVRWRGQQSGCRAGRRRLVGRLLVNDPAGDREQAARKGGPMGGYSPTGVRYWNGDGDKAVYEWDSLAVRWVMTVGPATKDADRPEDG